MWGGVSDGGGKRRKGGLLGESQVKGLQIRYFDNVMTVEIEGMTEGLCLGVKINIA